MRALAAGRAPPGGFCYPGPAGEVALPPPLVPDEKGYVDFGTKLRFTVDVAACTVAVAVNGFTQEIGSTSIRTPARLVVVGSDIGVRLLSVESARPSLGFAAAAAPAKEAAPPVDTRTTAERLQGTWMVHHLSGTELTTGECSQQSTGLWIVDGDHATFPLQNDRTFDVVTAADGSVTLERTAEGYKAALKVFHDSGNHVEWDGGAHWTRLDGKWSVADDSVGTFGGKTSVEVYGGTGTFAVGSTDKSIEWHTEKPDCTVCQFQYGEVSGWRAMTVELAATSAGVYAVAGAGATRTESDWMAVEREHGTVISREKHRLIGASADGERLIWQSYGSISGARDNGLSPNWHMVRQAAPAAAPEAAESVAAEEQPRLVEEASGALLLQRCTTLSGDTALSAGEKREWRLPADGAEVFRLEVMDAAPKGVLKLRRSPYRPKASAFAGGSGEAHFAGGAANSGDVLSIKPELVLRLGGSEALHGVAKTTPHAAADLRFDAHGSSTLQITWEGRRLNSPSPASSDPFVPFRAVVTALAPLMRPATAKCARQLLLTSLGRLALVASRRRHARSGGGGRRRRRRDLAAAHRRRRARAFMGVAPAAAAADWLAGRRRPRHRHAAVR